MSYTAKDIFITAQSFLTASSALNEKLSETNDIGTYLAPIVTNTSFAIELLLKCIYMIENKKPAPNKHGLDELFQLLQEESKMVIKMVYDIRVEQYPTVQALKQKVPEMSTDLDAVFKEISGSFVKWRYSYEKKITGFQTSGPIIDALLTRIQILEPKWFAEQDPQK